MKRLQTLGITVLAALTLTGLAASAASAHSFEYNLTSGTWVGTPEGNQVFKTPAATVTCTKDSLGGSFAEIHPYKVTLKAEYSSCTAPPNATVTIAPVEYEFVAEHETTAAEVKILKASTLTVTQSGLKCVITIAVQGLKTIEYLNNMFVPQVFFNAKLTKLTSSATGPLCLKTYTNNSEGTFTGNNLVKVPGGEMVYH